MQVSDGMTYAPVGKPCPVVKPGEFVFSAAHLDHGHIYGMVNALIEAGGTLKSVYDPQPERVANFLKTYPQAKTVSSEEALLDDKDVMLVNGDGEQYFNAKGVTGYPFFGQLILDCLNRTENAMTQAHCFKAAELCLQAQAQAVRVKGQEGAV